jgi:hypothetical protein
LAVRARDALELDAWWRQQAIQVRLQAALDATAPCIPDAGPSAGQSFVAAARMAAPAHSVQLAEQPWSAVGPEAQLAAEERLWCWKWPGSPRPVERPAGLQPEQREQPEPQPEEVQAALAL